MFNYKWYETDLRYFMLKGLNNNFALDYTSKLRQELLDYSYYKIKPKFNYIRDGFNLSDFYSIRHRGKNVRYRKYLTNNSDFQKNDLNKIRWHKRWWYKRYKENLYHSSDDKFFNDGFILNYLNMFTGKVNLIYKKNLFKQAQQRIEKIDERSFLYDVDKSWLSFVPEYISKYPLYRHRSDFYDVDSVIKSDVDFSFNAKSRRKSKLGLNKFKLKDGSFMPFFMADFMKNGLIRTNSLNLLNGNDLQLVDNINFMADDVNQGFSINKFNYLYSLMRFKYPFSYDYFVNKGNVFSPYSLIKEYDWNIENSLLNDSRRDIAVLEDIEERSKFSQNFFPFKYVVKNKFYEKDRVLKGKQKNLNFLFPHKFSRLFKFKNIKYLNQLNDGSDYDFMTIKDLENDIDEEKINEQYIDIYTLGKDIVYDTVVSNFDNVLDNRSEIPFKELELVSNRDSDGLFFRNLKMISDANMVELNNDFVGDIAQSKDTGLSDYDFISGLDDMKSFVPEINDVEHALIDALQLDDVHQEDANNDGSDAQAKFMDLGKFSFYRTLSIDRANELFVKKTSKMNIDVIPYVRDGFKAYGAFPRYYAHWNRKYLSDDFVEDYSFMSHFDILGNSFGKTRKKLRFVDNEKIGWPDNDNMFWNPLFDKSMPTSMVDLMLKNKSSDNMVDVYSFSFDGMSPTYSSLNLDEDELVKDFGFNDNVKQLKKKRKKNFSIKDSFRNDRFATSLIKSGKKRTMYSNSKNLINYVDDSLETFYEKDRIRRYVPSISAKWKNFYYWRKYYSNNIKNSFPWRRFYKDRFLGTLYFPSINQKKIRNFKHARDLMHDNNWISYCLDLFFLIVIA